MLRIASSALQVSICAVIALAGCTQHTEMLEVNPEGWAPPAVGREWAPVRGSGEVVGSATEVEALSDLPSSEQGRRIGLDELITFALARNPGTRRVWDEAQSAAATAASARASYYPTVSVESNNGYQRLVDLVPKHWGTLKAWQSRSLVSMD